MASSAPSRGSAGAAGAAGGAFLRFFITRHPVALGQKGGLARAVALMMPSATFVPVDRKVAAATGLMPMQGDGFLSGKKMLYPSPASGNGSRLFLLLHVLTHGVSFVLSLISMIVASDDVKSDHLNTVTTFSLILLILGILSILIVSGISKEPFKSNPLMLVLGSWAFFAAFAAQSAALSIASNSVAADHHSIVWSLLAALSQSVGVAFVIVGFAVGVAASATIE